MQMDHSLIEEILEEIERRRRILLTEVIQLAEQKIPGSKRAAVELANRAIIRLTQRRRIEIGFRY